MNFVSTRLKDVYLIEPQVFGDSRGYFMESFKKDLFDAHCGVTDFIQDNESKSGRGVLRGLHFQYPPYAQAKLVRVVEGEVLDVVLDLRRSSETFGQFESFLLSGDNKKQVFVPKGFAHGFVVLSESAVFSYKVDAAYRPDQESGIRWNDPDLNIDWKMDEHLVHLSSKDLNLPFLSQFDSPFS